MQGCCFMRVMVFIIFQYMRKANHFYDMAQVGTSSALGIAVALDAVTVGVGALTRRAVAATT